ncbi:mucoidy inhibitor MuiA family protein [Thioalkalivibrio sp.]|uniref:mucoidy inhibitor MuiA family protein n=1 Tax=Thioalkalivibrio sp. TaxID=2093813 RepID=UPI0039756783
MVPQYRFRPIMALLVGFATMLPSASVLGEGITQVTVYPDRAHVVREHTVELDAGKGMVRIHPLPAGLDPASLRVRAEGSVAVQLQHVETRTVPGRDMAYPRERALTEALQAAQDARRGLSDGRRAQTLKLSFIEHLTENAGAVEPALAPEQWHRAWGLIGEGALDALEQTARIDRALRDADAEIARIERELNALRTDRRDSIEAGIHYHTEASGTALITLEYAVPGASWSPLYEARLDTAAATLEWVQRAEVRQNTGEDWQDVTLYLSTSRPGLGGDLPELQSWFIDIAPPHRPLQRSEADALGTMAASPAVMEQAMPETTAFTARYRVPGRVRLPADNRQQRFLLASQSYAVDVSARAVPAIATAAYLFAETVFEGATPMLPGPVNLFQDGQMAGQTRVGTVAPGMLLRLAFGVDDRIEIRHELEQDLTGREGLLRRQKRLERGYRIILNNHHDRALSVTVLDRLPEPRDERITVELTPATTPPTERDVDGRLGVLAWTTELEAGSKTEIRFGYVVSWPEDEGTIQGLGTPRR